MNQQKSVSANKQTPLGVSLKTALLTLVVMLVVCTTQAAAQQSLGDLAKEYGVDWLVGNWVTTTEEGEKLQLIYRWKLNKHLITMQIKVGEFEYLGMVFYKPMDEQVIQVGADNRGGGSRGLWTVEGDKAILKIEYTDTYGETRRFAAAHSRIDKTTMKVELYGVDEGGNIADEPWSSSQYKRQKRAARKK